MYGSKVHNILDLRFKSKVAIGKSLLVQMLTIKIRLAGICAQRE
jgi:hypothetical protein